MLMSYSQANVCMDIGDRVGNVKGQRTVFWTKKRICTDSQWKKGVPGFLDSKHRKVGTFR
jgi:hypothetical protein